jgi:Methyltransferase domain/LicD family
MPKPLRADKHALRLAPIEAGNPIVDIFFDEHRVWSTKLPNPHPRTGIRRIPWPDVMVPYLRGVSTVTIRSSATGEDIASQEVHFGGRGRVAITDPRGRWLAIDKWNRFGPSFDGDSSGVQDRMLASAAQVAGQLEDRGYPVYIVGGTLLGAMRSGTLLPHDDDIDFAFLCQKSDPQDVTLVSFELERQLASLGYTVVRHSHAHLELVFFTKDAGIDYYIDIFTGYYSADGLYNQPFALRGELAKSELLPTKDISINGVALPAPAVPEAWLEFAYGPNWRIPDPSFQWKYPHSTLRRFENSFGVFNRQRVFWEKTWQQVDKRTPSDGEDFEDVDRFLQVLPERAFVIDLGCGDGRHAESIAAAGHRVLGVDYSFEALRVARQTQPEDVEYRFLNLNDRHSLLLFALEMIDQGHQPYFFARNLLHVMPQLGRSDVFAMLRCLLTPETFLYATFDATPVPRIPPNPLTWNLRTETLSAEAWRGGLGTTLLIERQRNTPFGQRQNVTALVWL